MSLKVYEVVFTCSTFNFLFKALSIFDIPATLHRSQIIVSLGM